MNKNILVFLHGSGGNENSYKELVEKIANYFEADIVRIKAQILHDTKDNGFMWFHKFVQNGRRDAVKEDFEKSLLYVENEIKKLDMPLENIILFGHSQGGMMACCVALDLKIKKAITVCADMPYNLEYTCKTSTPIDWYECKKDGYIDKHRQASYRLIEKISLGFKRKVLPNSTHFNFEHDFEKLMKNNQF